MVWALREYNDPTPLIFSVGENDEVSIKYVAETIIQAFNFTGPIRVYLIH